MAYGKQDSKLRRMHHLPDDEGADVGFPETVGRLADSLAGNQVAVYNEGNGFFCLTGLEIAEDHMELIEKFMVEGPQGVQHAFCPGKLVRQGFHLRPVV